MDRAVKGIVYGFPVQKEAISGAPRRLEYATTPIDLEAVRKEKRLQALLIALKISEFIALAKEPPYVHLNTQELKRAVIKYLLLDQTLEEEEGAFLRKIGALPTEEDLVFARREADSKYAYEKETNRLLSITKEILEALFQETTLQKDGLSPGALKSIVEYTLKSAQRENDGNSDSTNKQIPRGILADKITEFIQEHPNCEVEVWTIIEDLWEKNSISNLRGIRESVFEKLDRPTERVARNRASEKLAGWLNDIAIKARTEPEVMDWMFKKYQEDFTGRNQAYGEQFGHVYLEEVTRAIKAHNQDLEDREERLNERMESEMFTTKEDEREEEILRLTDRIDLFFPKRLAIFFLKNGIRLK